ncbi:unnamed protein product [Camellia sinensis]
MKQVGTPQNLDTAVPSNGHRHFCSVGGFVVLNVCHIYLLPYTYVFYFFETFESGKYRIFCYYLIDNDGASHLFMPIIFLFGFM